MIPQRINTLLFILCLLTACTTNTNVEKEELTNQYDSCHSRVKEYLQTSPNSALRCAKAEIEIAKTIEDSKLILTGYLDASRSLYLLHQYEMALKYAHEAINLSKGINDLNSNAEAKRLCGAIYTDLDNKEYAWKYLNEAVEYYVAQKDTDCYIRTLGTKAIALGKSEEYDECIQTFRKVYELSRQQNNYAMMLTTLLNLTNAYTIADQENNSFRMLDSIRTNIPSQFITSKDSLTINSYIGELLFRQKRYGEAKNILQKSISRMRSQRNYEVLQSTLKSLIKIAKEEKDFANLPSYYEEVFAIQDSIVSIEMRNKVNDMELFFNVAKKDAEINTLIMQNKWNKQRLLLIITIIVSISAFILIRLRSNARMITFKAQVLDNELKNKREELTNLAIYNFEQKRITDNLYKNLKQISNTSEDANIRKALYAICSQIIKTSNDEGKTQINTYIDAKYKDFIIKLTSRCPDLTDSEKRICAMLLVDFSTKEISEVLNISDRSINNIRSKIRKKLNIPEDNSIPTFLKKL